MEADHKDRDETKEKERCIVCGEETEYRIDVPIGYREFYIQGLGQLCKRCYDEIYLKESKFF